MKQIFEIFSGTPKNALWLENVEGSLSHARERLQQIAGETPGQYFLFCTITHTSVAEIETFAIPHPNLQAQKKKSKSSAA